jgi:hypothetical protein
MQDIICTATKVAPYYPKFLNVTTRYYEKIEVAKQLP